MKIDPNTEIQITLTLSQWEKIEEAVSGYCDCGPTGEGWKSDELSSATRSLENALRNAEYSMPNSEYPYFPPLRNSNDAKTGRR